MDEKLLRIYLNDHLGFATAGVELARRSLKSNRGTEFEPFLERLSREVDEDRVALMRAMDDLGIPKSAVKRSTAVVAERIGRLKLNGRVLRYSPLSRVLELEGLVAGVDMKLSLWRNLRDATEVASRPQHADLDALIERAERQRAALEEQRVAAARLAFSFD